ncbi:MAG: type II toxin-antitoxin system VapB family antitoxin [Vicinamibacterales bacterium]
MRTNIDVDDELMKLALQVTGEPTKRAVVHRALRLLLDTHAQAGIRRLKGKARWTGDLAESRKGRVADR